MKLCAFCKKSRPVIRVEVLHNPYTECLNCGATVSLPEKRYRVDWTTEASLADGRPWYQFFRDRKVAIDEARQSLLATLDRAVVTDRWGIEQPLVFLKKEPVNA